MNWRAFTNPAWYELMEEPPGEERTDEEIAADNERAQVAEEAYAADCYDRRNY